MRTCVRLPTLSSCAPRCRRSHFVSFRVLHTHTLTNTDTITRVPGLLALLVRPVVVVAAHVFAIMWPKSEKVRLGPVACNYVPLKDLSRILHATHHSNNNQIGAPSVRSCERWACSVRRVGQVKHCARPLLQKGSSQCVVKCPRHRRLSWCAAGRCRWPCTAHFQLCASGCYDGHAPQSLHLLCIGKRTRVCRKSVDSIGITPAHVSP